MNDADRTRIVNQILSGTIYLTINGRLYRCSLPSYDVHSLGYMFYNKIMETGKYQGLMTLEEAKMLRELRRIWTNLDEENEKKLNEHLDNLKVQLYDALFNKKKQKQIRRAIVQAKNSINALQERKTKYDNMTLEFYAFQQMEEFMTALCISDSRGNPIYTFENFIDADPYILRRFIHTQHDMVLSTSEYRELARTEPFRSLWGIKGAAIFSNSHNGPPSMSQSYLAMFARMYDSVNESIDRPSDDVINDDDMLDGWFIKQRREREAERRKKEAEQILDKRGALNKRGGRGELFVVAESPEEAQRIFELNDPNARGIIASRKKTIKEKGGAVDETELPDSQLLIRQQALQEMKRGR